ncbi:MAG: hypothetical protein B5M56_03710 [Desulfococcus sp. 4484_241]|nr:MAG: hypothetical protein B5M56_03710 [Desulfococcus sp. 4484_241]
MMRIYLPTEEVRSLVTAVPGAEGFLEIFAPADGDSLTVEEAYRTCMQWKEATLGADVSFTKVLEHGTAPFFDENTISYLRSDILGHVSLQKAKREELLLSCRVFLRLALDHDMRQIEVAEGLGRIGSMEKRLFESIRGTDEDNAGFPGYSPDSRAFAKPQDLGAQMARERLGAWSAVAAADPLPSGLLVTDSSEVMNLLLEVFPGLKQVAKIEYIPDYTRVEDRGALVGWQEDFSSFMERLVSGKSGPDDGPAPPIPADIADSNGPVLSVFLLPGVDIVGFLEMFAPALSINGASIDNIETGNLLIGHLSG